jgi:TolB protein
VRLKTHTQLLPLYLTKPAATRGDWRHFDEVREVLEKDMAASGFFSLLPADPDREEKAAGTIDFSYWKKEGIKVLVQLSYGEESLSATVYDLTKERLKRYPPLRLSRQIDQDRRLAHQLADAIQQDFTGVPGIASLRIVYAQREKSEDPRLGEWISEIWVCDADGALPRQVTREKNYCVSPSFFPGRDEIYFVSYKGGQSKLCSCPIATGKVDPLLMMRGSQLLPAISSSGYLLAFISDAAGRPDLFIQTLDREKKARGKARQLFTAPRATQASPSFSPDAKQIAFVSDKDGVPRIYTLPILDPRATIKPQPRLITLKNRENTSPSWSPDGKKIAYSARSDGVRQIWCYDFETGEETQLTTGPENKENPSWAPDSLHLVYNTESDPVCELFVIDLHTLEPRQISSGGGQKRFPSWENAPARPHF